MRYQLRASQPPHGAPACPHTLRVHRIIEAECAGVEWRPDQVVVVTPPGKLPQVETRGSSLNGSVIPAQRPFTLAQQHARIPDHSSNGSGGSEHTALHSPSSVMQPSPWLAYEGRWGSSVLAPATQDWFFRAENPVSRTWLQQVGKLRAHGVRVQGWAGGHGWLDLCGAAEAISLFTLS